MLAERLLPTDAKTSNPTAVLKQYRYTGAGYLYDRRIVENTVPSESQVVAETYFLDHASWSFKGQWKLLRGDKGGPVVCKCKTSKCFPSALWTFTEVGDGQDLELKCDKFLGSKGSFVYGGRQYMWESNRWKAMEARMWLYDASEDHLPKEQRTLLAEHRLEYWKKKGVTTIYSPAQGLNSEVILMTAMALDEALRWRRSGAQNGIRL